MLNIESVQNVQHTRSLAEALQRDLKPYVFAGRRTVLPRIVLRRDAEFLPVWCDRDEGISISMHDMDRAARYLGVAESRCAALLTLIGLCRWRALSCSPDIIAEDLIYTDRHDCLFAPIERISDFVTLADSAHVCTSCRAFYETLGAGDEVAALDRYISEVVARIA